MIQYNHLFFILFHNQKNTMKSILSSCQTEFMESLGQSNYFLKNAIKNTALDQSNFQKLHNQKQMNIIRKLIHRQCSLASRKLFQKNRSLKIQQIEKKLVQRLRSKISSYKYQPQDKQLKEINQQIIDKFNDESRQELKCICCGKRINQNIKHLLPFYAQYEELTQKQLPQYLHCELKYSRIICSLLNQGGGCIIIGQRKNNLDQHKGRTKSIKQFLAPLNKKKSKWVKKFASNYFNNTIAHIGTEESHLNQSFNIKIQYVEINQDNKYTSDQVQTRCEQMSFQQSKEQKYFIRVKIIPLFRQKIYYVRRHYQNRQLQQFWIRNTSGDLCSLQGANIYKFMLKLFQFDRRIQFFVDKKIRNYIHEKQIQKRIQLGQKYSIKFQFDKQNQRLRFCQQPQVFFILIISSHKQLYLFQKLNDILEEKKIKYQLSEPFIKYKGTLFEKYWCFSVRIRSQILDQIIMQNFKWHLNKFFKIQKYLQIKLGRGGGRQLQTKILRNLQRLIRIEINQTSIKVREIQKGLILQFNDYQSCIFSLIYLRGLLFEANLPQLFKDSQRIQLQEGMCDN